MSRNVSLHLGVNRVDPNHYGTEARLRGCINDATAMFRIAQSRGFAPTLLTDDQATSTAVFNFIRRAARDSQPGDTVMVTAACHGSQVDDENNDERTGMDQTWCMFDRMIVDDELAEAWSLFQRGVRILLVSDSCHSASIARMLAMSGGQLSNRSLSGFPIIGQRYGDMSVTGYRLLPEDAPAFVRNRDLYSSIQRKTTGSEHVNISATVITLSACLDGELAADGETNGLYTRHLLSVWNKANHPGGYRRFQEDIARAVGTVQRPQFSVDGIRDSVFENEQPFTTSSSTISQSKNPVYPPAQPFGTNEDLCRLEVMMPARMVEQSSDDILASHILNDGGAMLQAFRRTRSSTWVGRTLSGRIEYHVDQNGAVTSERGIWMPI